MDEIILYGAGSAGVFAESQLFDQGITIKGFCDGLKEGTVLCDGTREYPILKFENIIGKGYRVIVTISKASDRKKITEKLTNANITVTPLTDILDTPEDKVTYERNYVANFHINAMDPYFEAAEDQANLAVFWAEDSIFYQMFRTLDLTSVVELACGRGRHVPQYIKNAGHITLVDILEKNIQYCQERFSGENKIRYYVNNGCDFQKLETGGVTALFTYDAMVHFESLDVWNYLKETYRILKNGGKALFHHSNNTEDYRVSFKTGASGRNYMSRELFAHFADRAGFRVIEQRIIDWDETEALDCLTLLEKT